MLEFIDHILNRHGIYLDFLLGEHSNFSRVSYRLNELTSPWLHHINLNENYNYKPGHVINPSSQPLCACSTQKPVRRQESRRQASVPRYQIFHSRRHAQQFQIHRHLARPTTRKVIRPVRIQPNQKHRSQTMPGQTQPTLQRHPKETRPGPPPRQEIKWVQADELRR